MGKRDLWVGMAIGAGVLATAPFVVPVVVAVMRPLAREVIKQGLLLGELLRVRAAVALESLDDLLAEAREEARSAIEAREGREPARAEGPGGDGAGAR